MREGLQALRVVSAKIDDAKAAELHAEHQAGATVAELGRRHWERLGFKNANSAQASIWAAFRQRGLEVVKHRPAPRTKPKPKVVAAARAPAVRARHPLSVEIERVAAEWDIANAEAQRARRAADEVFKRLVGLGLAAIAETVALKVTARPTA